MHKKQPNIKDNINKYYIFYKRRAEKIQIYIKNLHKHLVNIYMECYNKKRKICIKFI
jgi:hypothetical protein